MTRGRRARGLGVWTLADDGWSAGSGGVGACVGKRMMWDSENGSWQAQWMGLSNSSAKKALQAGPPGWVWTIITLLNLLDHQL